GGPLHAPGVPGDPGGDGAADAEAGGLRRERGVTRVGLAEAAGPADAGEAVDDQVGGADGGRGLVVPQDAAAARQQGRQAPAVDLRARLDGVDPGAAPGEPGARVEGV